MKKLLLSLLLLIVPQSAWGQEIVWGSNDYNYIKVKCSTPSNLLKFSKNKEIKTFLSHYHKGFIKNNLKKIVVCKELSRFGLTFYRGTYDNDSKTLFVEVGNGELNDTEYVLHHELSSIVWLTRANHYLIHRWKSYSNFEYKLDGNISSDWTVNDREQEKGALYRYCKTTPENDFNVVAAFYISDYLKPLILKAEQKHWRIKGKVNIIKEIYAGILN